MKINSLYIKDYRLLKELHIPFGDDEFLPDESYSLTVLAGLNGSGKSTILRAIGEIFSAIKADQPCEFDFSIAYELSNDITVAVEYCSSQETPYSVKVNGEEQKGFDQTYKPNDLIVHTTGLEYLWDEIITQEESQTASETLLDDPLVSRIQEQPITTRYTVTPLVEKPPFFIIRQQVTSLVTLCGLLRWLHEGKEESLIQEVLDQLHLQKPVGFSLDFQLHPSLSNYDEFNRLLPLCDEHLQQGAIHKLIFEPPSNGKLLSGMNEGKAGFYEAFKDLEALLYPNNGTPAVLQQVEIFFPAEKASEEESDEEEEQTTKTVIQPFSWLSDGEQNFLSRMAMLTLLDIKDSIILMDEPEVHFNDYWKRKIVTMVDQVLRNSHNHMIMTTHSSVVLSDVFPGQVMLVRKNDEGRCEINPHLPPTFGTQPGDIMVNLLGTGESIGAYSSEYIKQALGRGDKEELSKLLDQVGPGFLHFLIRNRLGEFDA